MDPQLVPTPERNLENSKKSAQMRSMWGGGLRCRAKGMVPACPSFCQVAKKKRLPVLGFFFHKRHPQWVCLNLFPTMMFHIFTSDMTFPFTNPDGLSFEHPTLFLQALLIAAVGVPAVPEAKHQHWLSCDCQGHVSTVHFAVLYLSPSLMLHLPC